MRLSSTRTPLEASGQGSLASGRPPPETPTTKIPLRLTAVIRLSSITRSAKRPTPGPFESTWMPPLPPLSLSRLPPTPWICIPLTVTPLTVSPSAIRWTPRFLPEPSPGLVTSSCSSVV